VAGATPSDAEPWYAQGLRFRCTACGQCCTGEPGHVWVDKEEVRRMAKARGLSARVFGERFVRRVGRRLSLVERENGDCCMLKDGRCTVYAVKPVRCSTFPFWDPVLADRRSWEEAAERCEGIGQGDLYDLQEIERIRGGDPAPMRAKHARPPETPVTSRFNPDLRPAPGPDWEGALAALASLYRDLERDLPSWGFSCSASGNCCDFDAYGHRLFVTTLEYEHFVRHAPVARANPDPRQCPAWGPDRLCKAREGRMLGCRTYHCPPWPRGGPPELHARYHARLQALHRRFGIPYAYRDLVDWAAGPAPSEAGPAAGS
jgi:hypothetical protein